MMYVFRYDGKSFTFPADKIKSGSFTYTYNKKIIDIYIKDEVIEVIIDKKQLPGYYEMWFSWIIHNQKNGIIFDLNI